MYTMITLTATAICYDFIAPIFNYLCVIVLIKDVQNLELDLMRFQFLKWNKRPIQTPIPKLESVIMKVAELEMVWVELYWLK